MKKINIIEKKAIEEINNLEKIWPSSLWLFSASGTLHIMKCDKNGEKVFNSGGYVDIDYCVGEVSIMNDGGDW
jgi:hypothetical protein